MRLPSVLLLPILVTLASCASTGRYLASPAQQTGPGSEIPAILAHDQYGKTVNLRTAASSSPWAVIFFYPEANTPG